MAIDIGLVDMIHETTKCFQSILSSSTDKLEAEKLDKGGTNKGFNFSLVGHFEGQLFNAGTPLLRLFWVLRLPCSQSTPHGVAGPTTCLLLLGLTAVWAGLGNVPSCTAIGVEALAVAAVYLNLGPRDSSVREEVHGDWLVCGGQSRDVVGSEARGRARLRMVVVYFPEVPLRRVNILEAFCQLGQGVSVGMGDEGAAERPLETSLKVGHFSGLVPRGLDGLTLELSPTGAEVPIAWDSAGRWCLAVATGLRSRNARSMISMPASGSLSCRALGLEN